MENTTTTPTTTTFLHLTVIAVLITTVFGSSTSPYTNHTVGDSAGWFFDPSTNTSSTDFTKWAANRTFNLGDYLIFNTNTNHTVIQTYNETAYQSCNADDTSDTDTFEYSGYEIGNTLTLSVPLTVERPNYFFSDTNNGLQCTHGIAFKIVVKHGQGLPPSLIPPPRYVEPPSPDSSPYPPSKGNQQPEQFYNGSGVGQGANMRMWDRVFDFVGGVFEQFYVGSGVGEGAIMCMWMWGRIFDFVGGVFGFWI